MQHHSCCSSHFVCSLDSWHQTAKATGNPSWDQTAPVKETDLTEPVKSGAATFKGSGRPAGPQSCFWTARPLNRVTFHLSGNQEFQRNTYRIRWSDMTPFISKSLRQYGFVVLTPREDVAQINQREKPADDRCVIAFKENTGVTWSFSCSHPNVWLTFRASICFYACSSTAAEAGV